MKKRRDLDHGEVVPAGAKVEQRVDPTRVQERGQREHERAGGQQAAGKVRDVLPRVAAPDLAGEQRVDDAVQLGWAGARREPADDAAEAHERDAVAAREVGGRECRGRLDRRVERALLGVLGLRERVEEQHDVGALLGMLDVDVRDAAP